MYIRNLSKKKLLLCKYNNLNKYLKKNRVPSK